MNRFGRQTYTLNDGCFFFLAGLTSLKHEYHYTGALSVPEPSVPARMNVRFPLSEYNAVDVSFISFCYALLFVQRLEMSLFEMVYMGFDGWVGRFSHFVEWNLMLVPRERESDFIMGESVRVENLEVFFDWWMGI